MFILFFCFTLVVLLSMVYAFSFSQFYVYFFISSSLFVLNSIFLYLFFPTNNPPHYFSQQTTHTPPSGPGTTCGTVQVSILHILVHKNIVDVYQFYPRDPQYSYIVLEYMGGGQLFERMTKKVQYSTMIRRPEDGGTPPAPPPRPPHPHFAKTPQVSPMRIVDRSEAVDGRAVAALAPVEASAPTHPPLLLAQKYLE